MFLPNTDSFVLIRKTNVKLSFPVFLPPHHKDPSVKTGVDGKNTQNVSWKATGVNTWCGGLPNSHSFLLIRRPIVDPSFPFETGNAVAPPLQSTDSEQPQVNDQGRRTFLKVVGIAGAGIVASQLLSPKKASALILGSSPTTGVVGLKNAGNTRINPATEETVSTLATQATAATLLKTTDLALNAGVLDVKVTSTSGEGSSSFSDSGGTPRSALVDGDRHVQVDVLSSALPTTASTETTLQTISFGGKKYALKMTTVGSIDYVAEADTGTAASSALWRAKKIDSTSGIIITWADGNANFDNVATDLTTLTYS